MEDWGGKRSIDHYVLGKTLGIGSFGKVKLAVHKETSIKVAIKVLNKKKVQQLDMNDKVWREIKVLQLFAHPHIIRLYEVIDTPTDICVIMEYVSGGELFDYIVAKGRLSEDEARRFFQQIIAGVEYCHEYMVVHRDLKPENLLLDAALNVKIADFGLSNMMKDGGFLKTSCGSPNYAAPEVISGQLYAGSEVDIWSCGVILYALLCGNLPFDDENIANLFKKIKGGVYTMPGYLSEGCRDLIPRMLVVDPLLRISVAQLRQHSWFKCNLPGYLAFPAAVDRTRLVQVGVPKAPPIEAVNETVLVEMCRRLDISRFEAVDGLKAPHTNQISVAYNLILDARKAIDAQPLTIRQQERGDHSEDYTEFNQGDPFVSFGVLREAANPKARAAIGTGAADMPAGWREAAEHKACYFGQGDWVLGLHSAMKPDEIMHQILVALQSLGAVWKFQSPYHVKCWFGSNRRGSAGGERGAGGPAAISVKMSILLYRRRDGYGYVVDMRIGQEGSGYQFLAIARDLASTLKFN